MTVTANQVYASKSDNRKADSPGAIVMNTTWRTGEAGQSAPGNSTGISCILRNA